jgi:hypothetical protein
VVGLSVSTLNRVGRYIEEIERYCAQHEISLKQRKYFICLPVEKLESALAAGFKQLHGKSASIDDTHLKNAVHVATQLGICTFELLVAVSADIGQTVG